MAFASLYDFDIDAYEAPVEKRAYSTGVTRSETKAFRDAPLKKVA